MESLSCQGETLGPIAKKFQVLKMQVFRAFFWGLCWGWVNSLTSIQNGIIVEGPKTTSLLSKKTGSNDKPFHFLSEGDSQGPTKCNNFPTLTSRTRLFGWLIVKLPPPDHQALLVDGRNPKQPPGMYETL